MAADDHTTTNKRTDIRTGDDDDTADPTALEATEAMATLRESGGFAILRYDTGHLDIDYRWNPKTGAFEQLSVVDTGDTTRIDSYYELTDDTAEMLLRGPGGNRITMPAFVTYEESWYPGVSEWPDLLTLDTSE